MEQAYASALWKSVEGGKSAKEAVGGLIKVLETRGRITILPKILHAFKRIAQRNVAKDSITVSLGIQRDEKSRKEARAALASIGAKGADVVFAHDESLIGGWRLEGKGKLLDASYKKHLLDLYNRVTSV